MGGYATQAIGTAAYLGQYAWFAHNDIPAGWTICDYGEVPRTGDFAALYNKIGIYCGNGNGTTTWNKPDGRGRGIIMTSPGGLGSDRATARTLGTNGGAENHTLSIPEMPSHNHGGSGGASFYTNGAGGAFTPTSGSIGTVASTTASTGGGGAHNNMQPFIVGVMCICYDPQLASLGTTIAWGNISGSITNQSDLSTELKNAGRRHLHPNANEPPASNFAVLDTRNGRPNLRFSSGGSRAAIWTQPPFRTYKGGSIQFTFLCAMSSATTGNVVLATAIEQCLAGTDTVASDSFGSAISSNAITVPGTNGIEFLVTVTMSSGQLDGLTSADFWRLRVTRGTDTASGDLELYSVEYREV